MNVLHVALSREEASFMFWKITCKELNRLTHNYVDSCTTLPSSNETLPSMDTLLGYAQICLKCITLEN